MLCIRMLKVCSESIYKPLNLIFKSCLEMVNFCLIGKKLLLSQFLEKVTSSY